MKVEDRIITDKCGYNYIKVTPKEIMNWGGYCICNGCNKQFLDKDMNLIYVLTDTYCDECLKGIKKRWKTYSKEDLDYDLSLQSREALDWYKYHLDNDFRNKIMTENYKEINEEYKIPETEEEITQLFDDFKAFLQELSEGIDKLNENKEVNIDEK